MARKIKVRTPYPKVFARELMLEAESRFPKMVKRWVAGITYELYRGVVMLTPVLTGRARANWVLTLNGPSTRKVGRDDVAYPIGNWFSVTHEPMSAEEKMQIDRIVAAVIAGPLGRSVYLTNNLNYISLLESGTSAKAPTGMVELTIDYVTADSYQTKVFKRALAG